MPQGRRPETSRPAAPEHTARRAYRNGRGQEGARRPARLAPTPQSNPVVSPIALTVVAVCIAFIVAFCAVVCACSPRGNSSNTKAETLAATADTSSTAEDTPLVAEAASIATRTSDGLSLGDDGILTVVLDPGHGGEDQGTSGYGLIESDVVWAICEYCAAYLEQVDGVEVVLTRGETENLSLEDRALVAVDAGADILVSLHINYNEQDPRISGAYVYYPTELSPYLYEETSLAGQEVAASIMGELAALGLADNGVVEEPLPIDPFDDESLRYAYPDDDSSFSDYYGIVRWPRYYGVAAVLIEHAFLSNYADAELLSDEAFLQALGEADACGILEAFGYEIVGDEYLAAAA